MLPKQDQEKTKQAYEKPRLRAIELAAEEVLAIGCKMYGGSDGKYGNPDCGILSACSLEGS